MLLLRFLFQIRIQLRILLIMMMRFHRVGKRFHTHKVRRTVLYRVRLKKICCCKERIHRLIQPNLNQEAAAQELNKFKAPLVKFMIISNNQQTKAVQFRDHHTLILKKCKNSHHKIFLNPKEENQQVELLQRIKSLQIKAIQTTVFYQLALMETITIVLKVNRQ